jgi:hypothetical protein
MGCLRHAKKMAAPPSAAKFKEGKRQRSTAVKDHIANVSKIGAPRSDVNYPLAWTGLYYRIVPYFYGWGFLSGYRASVIWRDSTDGHRVRLLLDGRAQALPHRGALNSSCPADIPGGFSLRLSRNDPKPAQYISGSLHSSRYCWGHCVKSSACQHTKSARSFRPCRRQPATSRPS